MKTSQILSTAIILSLSNFSFAHENSYTGANSQFAETESALTLMIIDVKHPTCNGGSNGSATVVANGGKAPYTYNWNTFPAQFTPQASNLSSGIYFVEVTDANGTVHYESVHISDPNTSVIKENSVQADLDLTASVVGNNAPYTFEINGTEANSERLNNLPIGLHKIVITDANQCEMVQYIQVFEIQEHPNGSDLNNPNNAPVEFKQAKQEMKSKNDRHIQASNLIPTITEGTTEENLVTVSSR